MNALMVGIVARLRNMGKVELLYLGFTVAALVITVALALAPSAAADQSWWDKCLKHGGKWCGP